MRRETVRKSMRDVRGTVVVFSIRRRRVSGTQLPRPAPRPYRKVSWLSLFFHAINERLERPLSMALWRLVFIPSSSGILPALFSSRIPPRVFPLWPTCADVAAYRYRFNGASSFSLSHTTLPLLFVSFHVLCYILLSRLHFVSYCLPRRTQYA